MRTDGIEDDALVLESSNLLYQDLILLEWL
jgi:hypothetical protein